MLGPLDSDGLRDIRCRIEVQAAHGLAESVTDGKHLALHQTV